MRCFSVIALLAACISAASCMGMYGSYGAQSGGYEQYGAVQQAQQAEFSQSQSQEFSESSSASFDQSATSAYGASGAYGAVAGGAYGAAAGAAYGAATTGAYGAGYGGGYGAYGAGYGSAAYGASSAVAGAAQNSYGAVSSNRYMKSSSATSMSSASSASAVSAASASAYSASLSFYPKLSQIPFFSTCFNAMSADEMSYAGLWTDQFNCQSTLNSMFTSNSLFKSYFIGATGIDFSRYSAAELGRVYSVFGSNKAAFVNLVRSFARRGYVYNTRFASQLITGTSIEILSNAQRFQQLLSVQSWSDYGLSTLFANKYYSSRIAAFCGLSTFSEAAVSSALQSYFSNNMAASCLFFRHLLLGRVSSSCSFNTYAALSASSYASARSQYFNYYGGFYSKCQSFSRSSSFSSSSASAASSSSSFSSASSSSFASKSVSSISQYYGQTFASSSLFSKCFALESYAVSSESRFYSGVFNSGFDYVSAYSPLFKDRYFSRYLMGCVGGYYDVNAQMTSQLFSFAQQYPGFLARTTRLYARNGAFFTSAFGRLFLENDSAFFFSSGFVNQYRSQCLQVSSWNSLGLTSLFQSRYYQRKMCSFFGMSRFDYNVVSSAWCKLFQENFSGGLLALRHMIYRKYIGQSFSFNSYAALQTASYGSCLYKCPFYQGWSSYYQRFSQQSSYQRQQSYSRSQSQSAQQSSSSSFSAAGAASASAAAAGGGYASYY